MAGILLIGSSKIEWSVNNSFWKVKIHDKLFNFQSDLEIKIDICNNLSGWYGKR